MRKGLVIIVLLTSGAALSIVFGLMILMRKITLYQMNRVKTVQ